MFAVHRQRARLVGIPVSAGPRFASARHHQPLLRPISPSFVNDSLLNLPLQPLFSPPPTFDLKSATANPLEQFPEDKREVLKPLAEQGRLVVLTSQDSPLPLPRLQGVREENFGPTVVKLAPSRIILLGTSNHADDKTPGIKEAIQALQPDKVVLELCAQRFAALHTKAELRTRLPGKRGEKMELLLMLWQLMNAGERLGDRNMLAAETIADDMITAFSAMHLHPGADMRAAIDAAGKCGAMVYMGDQLVQETEKKTLLALSQMSLYEKLQLVTSGEWIQFMKGGQHPVDEVPPDAAQQKPGWPSSWHKSKKRWIVKQVPQLSSALMLEREAHLAYNLKWHPAVEGAQRVLGVVDLAHLRGIAYHLLQEQPSWHPRPSSMTELALLPESAAEASSLKPGESLVL